MRIRSSGVNPSCYDPASIATWPMVHRRSSNIVRKLSTVERRIRRRQLRRFAIFCLVVMALTAVGIEAVKVLSAR